MVLNGFVKKYHGVIFMVVPRNIILWVLNLMKKYYGSAMMFLRHFNDYCGNTVIAILNVIFFYYCLAKYSGCAIVF